MPTPFSKVFSIFTGKIQDDLYSILSVEEAELDMIDLLNESIVKFEFPKEDIRNKDDLIKEFIEDLSLGTISILGNLMVLEWQDRQINNISLIKQRMSSKDFKFTSQANHLEALLKLREETERRVFKLKRQYSYLQTGENYNKPDYSGLGGGT
ncbi:hypothetical protein PC41400_14480 [Paenibacillus chitinolyticus]|uniref:Uncharacterized protein n=1 Tax=Paenibacillus chitinolyticus TaxID=79263 RepID=A0A410WWJ0_9BACL|nr:hypothetical protein [Paenibacillus chitinolyticus]MCY9594006.1 hypothetical protein [Paenibacillus chitinolyticus]MCY9598551.1 hypothetical protein [Paenibacillus chitinolyticus]QAV18819.1 hypothetical protein PC41400_14480 [Paenibacillus chitinolyticus]